MSKTKLIGGWLMGGLVFCLFMAGLWVMAGLEVQAKEGETIVISMDRYLVCYNGERKVYSGTTDGQIFTSQSGNHITFTEKIGGQRIDIYNGECYASDPIKK